MSATDAGEYGHAGLRPLDVASYLRLHGWRQEAEIGDRGSIWLLPGSDTRDEADVTLPLRRDMADFTLRMNEVVRTLAKVENRREDAVVHDVQTSGSDLVRVRAPTHRAASGSLPLEEAVAFVERSRDLMLAAACAAIDKRPFFATRKPVQAMDYLSKVRMGQTEQGSYVLTILSPITPALSEGDLFPGLDSPEPYERRVVRTLTQSLAALEGATRQAASSGDVEAFRRAVRVGVSANLCDAVLGLCAVSPGEGLEVSVSWSRTRGVAENTPSRVVLGGDSVPLIQEATRSFKETSPLEDVELQGFVTRLQRGADQQRGEIVIDGLVDGSLRRVMIQIEREDVYSVAVQAHEQRQRVACAGDLVKEGRGYRLQSPRHFRLVEIDDLG